VELAQVLDGLERRLTDPATPQLHTLFWSLGMKSTARNALRGVVESVTDGAVNAEVVLRISPQARIVAIVTRQSVTDLGLEPGRAAIALINSSFIILAPGERPLRTTARNALAGTIAHLEPGAVNDEVILDLGEGKTLAATITHQSATDLGLQVGQPATALIKASHVILAVE
jgi:molybdate transport system regulatory protein